MIQQSYLCPCDINEQVQSRKRPLASRQRDHHNADNDDQSSPINPGRLVDHEALGRIWKIPAALPHPDETDQNKQSPKTYASFTIAISLFQIGDQKK